MFIQQLVDLLRCEGFDVDERGLLRLADHAQLTPRPTKNCVGTWEFTEENVAQMRACLLLDRVGVKDRVAGMNAVRKQLSPLVRSDIDIDADAFGVVKPGHPLIHEGGEYIFQGRFPDGRVIARRPNSERLVLLPARIGAIPAEEAKDSPRPPQPATGPSAMVFGVHELRELWEESSPFEDGGNCAGIEQLPSSVTYYGCPDELLVSVVGDDGWLIVSPKLLEFAELDACQNVFCFEAQGVDVYGCQLRGDAVQTLGAALASARVFRQRECSCGMTIGGIGWPDCVRGLLRLCSGSRLLLVFGARDAHPNLALVGEVMRKLESTSRQ